LTHENEEHIPYKRSFPSSLVLGTQLLLDTLVTSFDPDIRPW
jgi:hypothetical protein